MLISDLRPVVSERIEPSLQQVDIELIPVVEQVGQPGIGRSTLPVLSEVGGPSSATQAPPEVLDCLWFEADRHVLHPQLLASQSGHDALKYKSVPQSNVHPPPWPVLTRPGALRQQEFGAVFRGECLGLRNEGGLSFLV